MIRSLTPAYRGALFYTAFWGIMGVFEPFVNVYFSRLGLNGREIGLLSAFFPLMVMVFAPTFSALGDRNAWRVRLLGLALLGTAGVLMFMKLPNGLKLCCPWSRSMVSSAVPFSQLPTA